MAAPTALRQETKPSLMMASVIQSCRHHIIGILALSGFSSVLLLTPTVFMLELYGRVLPSRSISTLLFISLAVAAMYVMYGCFELARTNLSIRASLRISENLQERVSRALMLYAATPAQAAAINKNFRTIKSIFRGNFLSNAGDAPFIVVYFGAICMLSPYLGLVAAGAAAAQLFFQLRGAQMQARYIDRAEEQVSAIEALHVSATGIARQKAFRERAGLADPLSGQIIRSEQAHAVAALGANKYSVAGKVTRIAAQSAALGMGGYLAIRGGLSPAHIFAASLLMQRIMMTLENLSSVAMSVKGIRVGVRRIDELLTLSQKAERGSGGTIRTPTVSASSISLGYAGSSAPIVSNWSTVFEAGSCTLICGGPGSGKTTIASAIGGILLPQSGSIRIDSFDIQDISKDSLIADVAVCPQDFRIARGTVMSNIVRVPEDAPSFSTLSREAVEIARQVGLHGYIAALPGAYACSVADDDPRFSLRQRQLIGLIRSLCGAPKLVVLDDCADALRSAPGLQEILVTLKRSGSTIVMTALSESGFSFVDRTLRLARSAEKAKGSPRTVQRDAHCA